MNYNSLVFITIIIVTISESKSISEKSKFQFRAQRNYENNYHHRNYDYNNLVYPNEFFEHPTPSTQKITIDDNSNDIFKNSYIPQNIIDNSPIYYVKLPPAPYKYINGMGYISQSPLNILQFSLPPHSNVAVTNPFVQSDSIDSFINIPLDFISNGRPSSIQHIPTLNEDIYPKSIYHQYYPYQPSTTLQARYPSNRLRPIYSQEDSTIKHLKNNLIFNGRPYHIYIQDGREKLNHGHGSIGITY